MHNFSGTAFPVPVSPHPRSKEFLPNILTKTTFFQLKPLPPCPITTWPSGDISLHFGQHFSTLKNGI